ncbi:MAG: phenylacetate-CoA oxygenase subunit PaaC [Acidobacteriota bacterium]|nr:MAG: phenylacetate-CoA oxygenase subunit PaaC [Acidobacteriota bacterium]
MRADLVEYLLRLADDRVVLGHRLSEWCGHGPILEEDIALTNIALDFLGQANHLLELAGELEGEGRSADDLVYSRDEIDYRNCLLTEQPNGDFAATIARQLFFDVYDFLLSEQLAASEFEPLAGLGGKMHKEAQYHVRHSREWMLRLGDGTSESHRRAQAAVDALWTYTAELFDGDEVDARLSQARIAADLESLETRWQELIGTVLREATLGISDEQQYQRRGGRRGHHTEHLGHMLAEMQILARSNPGAKW